MLLELTFNSNISSQPKNFLPEQSVKQSSLDQVNFEIAQNCLLHGDFEWAHLHDAQYQYFFFFCASYAYVALYVYHLLFFAAEIDWDLFSVWKKNSEFSGLGKLTEDACL